ncbi:Panacea domain-containing protein [uncultured Sphingomonas sp.]|uniref:Panacea domain-containing protein n=1 Tax=uncultured Sphingomonas sp. TaxID=158754 RepID=UPI0025E49CE0|nr:type II toxin-antitoxin system antitoxin SocA domain-containing protein [uncultured Sphingomonas sp.]
MANAAAVADRFRVLSGSRLTPLQLIKLTYIAHGWSYPMLNRGLIGDRIEAWQYGPVVPTLYHAIKDYRASPVSEPLWRGEPLTADEDALVQRVYDAYGSYSGGQLSTMTHQDGTPWDIAWRRGRNSQITNDMIEDHYRRIHAERSSERTH